MKRLGPTQLAVLRDISEGRDPDAAAVNYAARCHRRTIAHDLLWRGLIRLLPHNNPDVVRGACQWRLTAKGQVAIGTGVAA